MVERFRCLTCGHVWKPRGDNPASTQCPQCRRHRIIDDGIFQSQVDTVVRFLRAPFQGEDPLQRFSTAMDNARDTVQVTFPDPFLAAQVASEVLREALARLGFPRPPRLPPLP